MSYRFTIGKLRLNLAVRVQNLTELQYGEGFQARGAVRTTSLSLAAPF